MQNFTEQPDRPMTNAEVSESQTNQANSLKQLMALDTELNVRKVAGNIEKWKLIKMSDGQPIGILHGVINRKDWAVDLNFIADDSKRSFLNEKLEVTLDNLWDVDRDSENFQNRVEEFQLFISDIKSKMI